MRIYREEIKAFIHLFNEATRTFLGLSKVSNKAKFTSLKRSEILLFQDAIATYVEEKGLIHTASVKNNNKRNHGRVTYAVSRDRAFLTYQNELKKYLNDEKDFVPCMEVILNSVAHYTTGGKITTWTFYKTYFISENQNNSRIESRNDYSISNSILDSQTKDIELNTALESWKNQVLQDEIWNPVQLIFNKSHQTINLYQPVYLSALNFHERILNNDYGEMQEYQFSQQLMEQSLFSVTIDSVLTSLSNWSVLLGVPGSGKTSTTKWILRQVMSDSYTDFKYAVYLSLADYEKYLSNYPESSCYECFFEVYLSFTNNQSKLLADMLGEKLKKGSDNWLFLLDGLDEVTPDNRKRIVRKLFSELSNQNVILTSRPSASLSLIYSNSNEFYFYNIIPLSPPSIQNLVVSYCEVARSSHSAGEILKTISQNIALQRLALTPFLLIAICEVIHRTNSSQEAYQLTPAKLLSRLIRLIELDHNKNFEDTLNAHDVKSLVEFADWLCFGEEAKRLIGTPASNLLNRKNLLKSRFLNEVGIIPGTFEFTHLRLQEYFAALSISKSNSQRIETFIEQHAFNIEWIEIACFLAGLSKDTQADNVLWKSLKKQVPWIEKELTGNGWLRLAKIVVASGHSLRDLDRLSVNLYDILTQYVLANIDVYPNPAASQFYIDNSRSDIKADRVIIIDAIGKKVLEQDLHDMANSIELRSKGSYTAVLMNDKEVLGRKKVLIQ